MAKLKIGLSKTTMIRAFKEQFKNAALYNTVANISVDEKLDIKLPTNKSDMSAYYITFKLLNTNAYWKTDNKFNDISLSGSNFAGINNIQNLFIRGGHSIDKLVITDSFNNVVGIIELETPIQVATTTSFLIDSIEIRVL